MYKDHVAWVCIYNIINKDTNEKNQRAGNCFSDYFSYLRNSAQQKSQNENIPNGFDLNKNFYLELISFFPDHFFAVKGNKNRNTFKLTDEELQYFQKQLKKCGMPFSYEYATMNRNDFSQPQFLRFNCFFENSHDFHNFNKPLNVVKFKFDYADYQEVSRFILAVHFIRWTYEFKGIVFIKKAIEQKKLNPKINIVSLLIWSVFTTQNLNNEYDHVGFSQTHVTFRTENCCKPFTKEEFDKIISLYEKTKNYNTIISKINNICEKSVFNLSNGQKKEVFDQLYQLSYKDYVKKQKELIPNFNYQIENYF